MGRVASSTGPPSRAIGRVALSAGAPRAASRVLIRSVGAFGGHGVVIPERRSASVTAVAWRTSAGAAARVPVA